MQRGSTLMQEPATQLFIRDWRNSCYDFPGPLAYAAFLNRTMEILMQQFPRNITAPSRLLSIFCGLAFATAALAAEPHFGNMVFTADADSKVAKEEFATDTPKIYLHVQIEDVAKDSKLTATWIAEKTDAAPPDYKIDSADVAATAGMDEATFTLSKPNAGWPVGKYRVELSINGKLATSEHFTVAK
jgi:hypothetical protein